METMTKSEVLLRHEEIMDRIMTGEVFIHPTDTIYGLSCNALDNTAVKKIRKIKERPEAPLSIWVPSIDWIRKFCEVTPEAEEWLDKLPGEYTLILKLKNKHPLAKEISKEKNTIGVRLPDHWFSKIVEGLGVPIITTSANKKGKNFMTSLEDLDQEIVKEISFTIYEGEKTGRPSKIVNLANGLAAVKKC